MPHKTERADIGVIGGGIAGLTAAVYAARAGFRVWVAEGDVFGGQITEAALVENYPGLMRVRGTDLADALTEQARGAGAALYRIRIQGAERERDGFRVLREGGALSARRLILATGAAPRRPAIPGIELPGVSYCPLCDGALYRGRTVGVLGGGSSALSAALELAETAGAVWIFQDQDHLTGEEALVRQVTQHPNVRIRLGVTVGEVLGKDAVTGVLVSPADGGAGRSKTHEKMRTFVYDCRAAECAAEPIPVRDAAQSPDAAVPTGSRHNPGETVALDALFVSIGRVPQTEPFRHLVPLNPQGYIRVGAGLLAADGIRCAGDCRETSVRQLTTAAADGTVAAVEACRELSRQGAF